MRAESKFSALIEDIYDAALEPERWNDVIVNINEFIGCRGCGLVSKDLTNHCGMTLTYTGVDPHYIKLYSESHAQFDPLVTIPDFGQVVGIPDLIDYDQYRKGPFYQEWLRPQGCVDVANALLVKPDSNSAILLAVLPGAGLLDDAMRRRIAMVVPHVRRALLIGRAVEAREYEASTFADIMDGLGSAIFFLDAGCRIVHANTAGHDILSAADFLRSVNGQLVARSTQINQRLREIFVGHGKFRVDARGIALPLTADDGERYVAHLLPLTAATRGATGAAYKSVAALFVRKAEMFRVNEQVMARSFDLTPAELRVMLSIIAVGGVPETATVLGVAESTVKTHLQRVFCKTGTGRQADLVKLAAGFANPLRH